MKQVRPYPKVTITPKAAKLLKSGHVWVYADEVVSLEEQTSDHPLENGCLVDVFEKNGTWHGTGFISQESTIRIRILSDNANDRFDRAFWKRRITYAWQHRKATLSGRTLPKTRDDSASCRVIFSEADLMPGLIVDKFENILVAQIGTVGMERIKDMLFSLLVEVFAEDGIQIDGIYQRADSPARKKEGLELYKTWWTDPTGEAPTTMPTKVEVEENGLKFNIDIENSQKTGFFLDQKYNRRAVREMAQGKRVLDCFSHVGPFGLNAAKGGAAFVRSVDISDVACELAKQNAMLNGLSDKIEVTSANVLEYLPKLRQDKAYLKAEGGPFDFIILDPPAFTKSRTTVKQAIRGYREINREAMRLLPRGGYLATCSCSHFMTRDLLADTIFQAARDAGVRIRLVQELQQAPDHPILWGVPETHYLDFFIFQIL